MYCFCLRVKALHSHVFNFLKNLNVVFDRIFTSSLIYIFLKSLCIIELFFRVSWILLFPFFLSFLLLRNLKRKKESTLVKTFPHTSYEILSTSFFTFVSRTVFHEFYSLTNFLQIKHLVEQNVLLFPNHTPSKSLKRTSPSFFSSLPTHRMQNLQQFTSSPTPQPQSSRPDAQCLSLSYFMEKKLFKKITLNFKTDSCYWNF